MSWDRACSHGWHKNQWFGGSSLVVDIGATGIVGIYLLEGVTVFVCGWMSAVAVQKDGKKDYSYSSNFADLGNFCCLS